MLIGASLSEPHRVGTVAALSVAIDRTSSQFCCITMLTHVIVIPQMIPHDCQLLGPRLSISLALFSSRELPLVRNIYSLQSIITISNSLIHACPRTMPCMSPTRSGLPPRCRASLVNERTFPDTHVCSVSSVSCLFSGVWLPHHTSRPVW